MTKTKPTTQSQETKVEVSQTPAVGETKKAEAKSAKVRSKKYQKIKAKIDKQTLYDLPQAVELAQASSLSKFDGKIDVHIVTTLEPGTVGEITFPHLETVSKKIVIADLEVIKQISEGKIDFDIIVATPALMPKLLPFAKILGPKGLMPNPKNGTLSDKPEEAVKKLQAGKTIVKTEKKAPLIHLTVGRVSQNPQEIVANVEELIKLIKPNKIAKLVLAPSMGPSVKVKIEK